MKSNIRDLMKAQMYQLVRNRNLRAVLLGLFAIAVFFGASALLDESNLSKVNAGEHIAAMLSMMLNIAVFAIAVVTGIVCADDFTDRTANHELASGRLRSESYAARSILAVIFSVSAALVTVLLMIFTALILYNRGSSLSDAALVQRVLLMIPVFIRISCFFVFVSYIVKRPIAVVGICYALIMLLGMMMNTGGGDKMHLLTGFGSLATVCHFDEWHAYGLNTPVYYVYEPFVKTGTAVWLVVVSLAASAVYLLLGYSFFHRDDIQ